MQFKHQIVKLVTEDKQGQDQVYDSPSQSENESEELHQWAKDRVPAASPKRPSVNDKIKSLKNIPTSNY